MYMSSGTMQFSYSAYCSRAMLQSIIGHTRLTCGILLLLITILDDCCSVSASITDFNNSTDVSLGITCPENQYRVEEDQTCQDCHCLPSCPCIAPGTECQPCSENRCALGWTDFPQCQYELPSPTKDSLKWYSSSRTTIEFEMIKIPSLNASASVFRHLSLRIVCKTQEGKLLDPVTFYLWDFTPGWPEELADLPPGTSLDCSAVITNSLSQDQSLIDYSFTARTCSEWYLPHSLPLTIHQNYRASDKRLVISASWLTLINDCHGYPNATYLVKVVDTLNNSTLLYSTLSENSKVDLVDTLLRLKPDTVYEMRMEAYDFYYKVPIKIYTQLFLTENFILPYVNASNIRLIQKPGIVHLNVTLWNADQNVGSFPPDDYEVLYKLTNDPDWKKETCTVAEHPGGTCKATVVVRFPGKSYNFKVRSSLRQGSLVHTRDSQDVLTIETLPCEKPGGFKIQGQPEFQGTNDAVRVVIRFSKPESNCDNFMKYKARYRKDSETTVDEEECLPNINYCTLDKLSANTAYTLKIIATNQANLISESDYITFETPQKAPDYPADLRVEYSNRTVIITWKTPEKDNGPVDKYRVNVYSSGKTVVNNEETTQNKYSFTGDYYTKYEINVQAHNIIDWGIQASVTGTVPETTPGEVQNAAVTHSKENREECVDFQWEKPSFTGGIIRSYMTRCSLIKTYSNTSIIGHVMSGEVHVAENRSLVHSVCNLEAGSHYNCSLTAKNNQGESSPVFTLIWTAPAKPHPPPRLIILPEDKGDTFITLFLPLADKRDGPASSYFVGVEKKRKSKRSVLEVNLTSDSFLPYDSAVIRYMAASLSESDVGREFTIGDGNSYGGYQNVPLEKDELYDIYYGVEITRGGVSKQTFIKLAEPVKAAVDEEIKSRRQMIIAIAIAGSIIILFCVVLVIFIMKCRRRRHVFKRQPTIRAELIPLDSRKGRVDDESDGAGGGTVTDVGPIPVSQLKSYVAANQCDISRQYQSLPTGFLHPVSVGSHVENRRKNRFANIIPYDHSRVKLSLQKDDGYSDYINANYIDGYKRTKQYIAASGPTERTAPDFWRMIWEQKSTCVVMVTKCVEEGKVKCTKYWPDEKETESYGDIQVTGTSSEAWADFTMKTFELSREGEKLTVYHFHFLSWPDHGVPSHSTPFLLFRRKVTKFYSSLSSPVVLHCSAGVGRTGTFIAIDYLLHQAKAENQVNVFNFIQMMRNQRISMVQTEDQYHYIYQALCEAIQSEDCYFLAPDFSNKYLTDAFTESGILDEQFEVLTELTEVNKQDYEVGAEKENRRKNRNSSVLPHDLRRAYIVSQPKGYQTYINAIFVNSYRAKDTFIATQLPLSNTVDDYLRLLYDHNVCTVVSLEPLPTQTKQDYGQFLPVDLQQPLETGLFSVVLNGINDSRANIVVCDVSITYNQAKTNATKTLKVFHANFWEELDSFPSSHDTFITLLEQVDKWNQLVSSARSPICVQCRDGNERSGVFITLWNALDRLKTEQEVDVFHTVQLLRMVRPQFIIDSAQYRFIYDVLYAYLQEFDLYANYK